MEVITAFECWSCGCVGVDVDRCLCDVLVARRKKPEVEVIDLALTAKLGSLSAVVCTQDHLVTDFKIAGLFQVFQAQLICTLWGLIMYCWLVCV